MKSVCLACSLCKSSVASSRSDHWYNPTYLTRPVTVITPSAMEMLSKRKPVAAGPKRTGQGLSHERADCIIQSLWSGQGTKVLVRNRDLWLPVLIHANGQRHADIGAEHALLNIAKQFHLPVL